MAIDRITFLRRILFHNIPQFSTGKLKVFDTVSIVLQKGVNDNEKSRKK